MIKNRTVVLGAPGFIGRYLVRRLKKDGIETVCPTSKELNLLNPECSQQLASLLKPTDTLVFISALTPDRGRDIATVQNNLTMGAHVAKAIKVTAPGFLMYVGSDAIYTDDAELLKESTPCAPSSYHGYMHLGRELILKEACGGQQPIPLCILRPVGIYGAGDTHNSYGPNRFLKTALEKNEIVLFGEGEEKRDHIHIDDVIEVLSQCLAKKYVGTLNVASGSSPSFFEIAQEIKKLLGGKPAIQCKPRASAITHKHFDITKAIRTLGSFTPTSLQEGLRKSISN